MAWDVRTAPGSPDGASDRSDRTAASLSSGARPARTSAMPSSCRRQRLIMNTTQCSHMSLEFEAHRPLNDHSTASRWMRVRVWQKHLLKGYSRVTRHLREVARRGLVVAGEHGDLHRALLCLHARPAPRLQVRHRRQAGLVQRVLQINKEVKFRLPAATVRRIILNGITNTIVRSTQHLPSQTGFRCPTLPVGCRPDSLISVKNSPAA